MQIYIITNCKNGKMYVGITTRTAEQRWVEHVAEARQGKRRTLLNAIRKYGPENFTVEQIGSADTWESLCRAEKNFIQLFGTLAPGGYNLTIGGDGVVGLSPDIRALISDKNRGRKHSLAALLKIGKASKGHAVSTETRKKISIAHAGKKLTAEHRAKLSAAKLGKKMTPRSAEHSARIAAGLRRAWARRKVEQ